LVLRSQFFKPQGHLGQDQDLKRMVLRPIIRPRPVLRTTSLNINYHAVLFFPKALIRANSKLVGFHAIFHNHSRIYLCKSTLYIKMWIQLIFVDVIFNDATIGS